MPTLWEILTRSKKPEVKPVEFRFYNPLKLRIGNVVNFDHVDFENLNFNLYALRESNRRINDEDHTFVDYDLTARPYEGDDVTVRLRLIPIPNPESETTHNTLLLKRIGECGYDEEFHKGLAFEVNKGEFTEGDNKYWRVNDIQEHWEVESSLLRDKDNSGKVDVSEVVKQPYHYWDYWREADFDGVQAVEFYIVEMDADTGHFEFWLGREIDQNRVSVH